MLGLFFFVRRSPYFGRRFCGRGAASAAVVEKIGGESFGVRRLRELSAGGCGKVEDLIE